MSTARERNCEASSRGSYAWHRLTPCVKRRHVLPSCTPLEFAGEAVNMIVAMYCLFPNSVVKNSTFTNMSSSASSESLLAELATAHKHVTEEIVSQFRSSMQGSADLTAISEDLVYWWGQWWQEWWVRAVVAYHVSLLLITVTFRKSVTAQLAVFATAACTVASAQQLNSLGAIYWEEFASQPYFDKHGAFISSVVSCPLIIVMMVVLVNCVCTAVLDMIALKRRQMSAMARQKQTMVDK